MSIHQFLDSLFYYTLEGEVKHIVRGYDAGSMGFGHYSFLVVQDSLGRNHQIFSGDAVWTDTYGYINKGDNLQFRIKRGPSLDLGWFCPDKGKGWKNAVDFTVLEKRVSGEHQFNINEAMFALTKLGTEPLSEKPLF
ncbi:hypothetical protein HYT51_01620 [Candidatus Woesearchaeota archaeon]|nr:hypothetical protein [Candidatus Woesearchaeota archaeon]